MPGTPAGEGGVAVVVEPATSAEIAPLPVQAYGLTSRERDILSGIARGLSTTEMATHLFLSRHTVRDYVKTKLFADHYADPLHATMVHAH